MSDREARSTRTTGPARDGRSRTVNRGRFNRGRRRRWLRPLLITVTLLAAFGGGTYLVAFSSVLDVRAVEVEGVSVLSEQQVISAAGIPLGGPLARTDLAAARAGVAELAPVAEVEVRRSWPHAVVVTVTERSPVAVLEDSGTTTLLDRTGVAYHEVAEAPADLPAVRARPGNEAAVRAGAVVAAALPEELAGRVEAIEADTRDSVEVQLTDGVRVRWGSAERSGRKAEVLVALMRQHESADGDTADGDDPAAGSVEPVSVYDVSVPERPTTRA